MDGSWFENDVKIDGKYEAESGIIHSVKEGKSDIYWSYLSASGLDLEGRHYIGLAPEAPASEAPAENTGREVIGVLGQISVFSEDPSETTSKSVPAPEINIPTPEPEEKALHFWGRINQDSGLIA